MNDPDLDTAIIKNELGLDIVFKPYMFDLLKSNIIQSKLATDVLEPPEYLKKELTKYLIDTNVLSNPILKNVTIKRFRNGIEYLGSDYFTNQTGVNVIFVFGATREFVFHKIKNIKIRYKIELSHGDMLIVKGDTLVQWKYSISKCSKVRDNHFYLCFEF